MTREELQRLLPPGVSVDDFFLFLWKYEGIADEEGMVEGDYCGIHFCIAYVYRFETDADDKSIPLSCRSIWRFEEYFAYSWEENWDAIFLNWIIVNDRFIRVGSYLEIPPDPKEPGRNLARRLEIYGLNRAAAGEEKIRGNHKMENEEVDMEYVKELLERNKTLPKETKKYLHKCEHCGQFLVPLLEFDICPYCDWQQNVDEDENEI